MTHPAQDAAMELAHLIHELHNTPDTDAAHRGTVRDDALAKLVEIRDAATGAGR